jgi:hypothetical protein
LLIFVVVLPWSAEEYERSMPAKLTGLNPGVENELSSLFPPLHMAPFPLVNDSVCIVDTNGVVLYWYLP